MSIEIKSIRSSENNNISEIQVFNTEEDTIFQGSLSGEVSDFDWDFFLNRNSTRTQRFPNISADSDRGREIIQAVADKNTQQLYNVLNEFIDDTLLGFTTQIRLSGIKDKIITKDIPTKQNEGVNEIKRFMTGKDFIKSYKIFGTTLKLPYSNYDTNESDGFCFPTLIQTKYGKRIGKKELKQLKEKESCTVEDVEKFCNKHQIPCKLANLKGKIIFKNDYPQNKKFSNLNAIISNHHIYPLKSKYTNFRPDLSTKSIEKCEDDTIVYTKNNKIFSHNGVIFNITETDIQNDFFKHMFPNFSHNADTCKVKAICYRHPNIQRSSLVEYDMKKCYFNIAYNIIDEYDNIGIFTLDSIWKEYGHHGIHKCNNYLLSQSCTEKLKNYGIINNFHTGYMIYFLLKKDLICDADICYEKEHQYKYSWFKIKNRMEKMIDNILKDKLGNISKEEKEKLITDNKIDKNFVFYNGLLGILKRFTQESFFPLPESEYGLLNLGEEEDWKPRKIGSNYEFSRTDFVFNNINTVNIYNHIVEQANIFMLDVLLKIQKKCKDAKLLKIQVDALGFDKEIKLPTKVKKYFKVIENPYKQYRQFNQQIYNGKEIIDKIHDSMAHMKENISYHGAPGTGKTYTVQNNHSYDISTTITNVCVNNIKTKDIESKTLYSLFQFYRPEKLFSALNKLKNKTIWIDEFSMIPRFMWNMIFIAASKYNVKLVISGDINQISPIGETKIDLDNIAFKKLMGKITLLKKDHRNDKQIIILRNQILNNNVEELKSRFKSLESKDDFTKFDRHIVFSHDMGDYVNSKIMESRGLKYEFKLLKKDANGKEEYEYNISNNVFLVCRENNKSLGLSKNDVWKVIASDKKVFKLLNIAQNKTSSFLHNQMHYFKVGFAVTAHSSQGLTIKEDFCIHECQFMINIDTSILYTAVTRGIKFDNIRFFNYRNLPSKIKKIKYVKLLIEDFGKMDEVKT